MSQPYAATNVIEKAWHRATPSVTNAVVDDPEANQEAASAFFERSRFRRFAAIRAEAAHSRLSAYTSAVAPEPIRVDFLASEQSGPATAPIDTRVAAIQAAANLVLKAKRYTDIVPDELLTAVTDAVTFIGALPVAPPTSIAASEDGEITLQWRIGQTRAIVTFEGDGSFGYALWLNGRYVPGAVEAKAASQIPNDLIEYLRAR